MIEKLRPMSSWPTILNFHEVEEERLWGSSAQFSRNLDLGSLQCKRRKATPAQAPAGAAPVQPPQMSVVDVVGKLEGLAAKHPEKLNWKTSIVDLMKLLGLDSSLNARKELAAEL